MVNSINITLFLVIVLCSLTITTAIQLSRYSGIVFIKPEKVGGSTMGGIVRRIAAHHNGMESEYRSLGKCKPGFTDGWNDSKLHIWANHCIAKRVFEFMDHSLINNVFKFTLVRHPVRRKLSEIWHYSVSRKGISMTSEKLLQREGFGDYMYNYIHVPDYDPLEFYNLIGTTERFDETLVMLKLMLNLTYSDILYLRSKDADYTDIDDRGSKMVKPPNMEELGADVTNHLLNNAATDLKLYERVDEELTRAKAILEPEFSITLAKFKHYLKGAQKVCALDRQRYNKDVQCYWNDNGCNFQCLDSYTTH